VSGRLITFEGVDGSGKTTQAGRLVAWLRRAGLPVVAGREPTDGPYGRRLRHATRPLTPAEQLDLFVRDRVMHVARRIRPALDDGSVVVLDRYVHSTLVYQGVQGVAPWYVRRLHAGWAPEPHLTVVLDVPVGLALSRLAARAGEAHPQFERRELLAQVAEAYRRLDGPAVRHVDATAAPDRVFEEVLRLATEALTAKDRKEAYEPDAG
jgi:dTMP kinase